MSKEIVLKFGPKLNIELNLIRDFEQKGLIGLIYNFLVNMSSLLIFTIFFLLFIISFLNPTDRLLPVFIGLYAFVAILLLAQIIKIILIKGNEIPLIPYDLLLLVFTTFITTSLFITTIDSSINYNIFGGSDFRAFSGISIVCLCLLYFFIILNNFGKNRIVRYMKLLGVSLLIAIFLNLVGQHQFDKGLESVFVIMIPSALWLSFMKGKAKVVVWGFLLVSLVSIFINADILNISLVALTLIIGLFILLLFKRKEIKSMFQKLYLDLDLLIKGKNKIEKLFGLNKIALFVIFSLILILACIIWLILNGFALSDVTNYWSLNSSWQDKALWVGNGFQGKTFSIFSNIFNIFGIVTFGMFVLFLTVNFKDRVELLKKKFYSGFPSVLSGLAFALYFVFGKFDELVFILFWLELSLFVMYKLFVNTSPTKNQTLSIRKWKFFKKPEYLKFNTYFQLGISMLIIIFGVYLVSLIAIIIKDIS